MTKTTTYEWDIRVSNGSEIDEAGKYALYLTRRVLEDGEVIDIDGSVCVLTDQADDPTTLDLDAAIQEAATWTGVDEWTTVDDLRDAGGDAEDPFGGWTVATATTTKARRPSTDG